MMVPSRLFGWTSLWALEPLATAQPRDGDRSAILAAAILTAGIARRLERDIPTLEDGGGDLNGSANLANLLGQAGTGCDRVSVSRFNSMKAGGGNYCGVV
jgi:hypothetical protein